MSETIEEIKEILNYVKISYNNLNLARILSLKYEKNNIPEEIDSAIRGVEDVKVILEFYIRNPKKIIKE